MSFSIIKKLRHDKIKSLSILAAFVVACGIGIFAFNNIVLNNQNISSADNTDLSSNLDSNTVLPIKKLDTAPLKVSIKKSIFQSDPVSGGTVKYIVTFNQPIVPSTLTGGNIILSGTAQNLSISTITEVLPTNGTTFEVLVSYTGSGTVTANIKYLGAVIDGVASGIEELTQYTQYGSSPVTDSSSNFYKIKGNGQLIKIDSDKVVTTITTLPTPLNTFNPDRARYNLAVDLAGNLYSGVDTNIYKITPSGTSSVFSTVGSKAKQITLDKLGNIYAVTDSYYDVNETKKDIYKISPSGISTLFYTVSQPQQTDDIVIDSANNMYIATSYIVRDLNGAGTLFNTISKITQNGVITRFAQSERDVRQITIDPSDNLYYLSGGDLRDYNVTRVTPNGTSTNIDYTDVATLVGNGNVGSIPIKIIDGYSPYFDANNFIIRSPNSSDIIVPLLTPNKFNNTIVAANSSYIYYTTEETNSRTEITTYTVRRLSIGDNTATVTGQKRIIGKVYSDKNVNGIQDANEPDYSATNLIPVGTTVNITNISNSLENYTPTINIDGTYSQPITDDIRYSVTINTSMDYVVTASLEIGSGVGGNPTAIISGRTVDLDQGKDGLTACTNSSSNHGSVSESASACGNITTSVAPTDIATFVTLVVPPLGTNNLPIFKGTCEPGATLTLTITPTNEVLGTTTSPIICPSSGTYAIATTLPIISNNYCGAIKATDTSGNIANASGCGNIVVTIVAPTTTQDTSFKITGTCTPSIDNGYQVPVEVSIRFGAGSDASGGTLSETINTICSNQGSYSVTPTKVIPVGQYTATAKAISEIGNTAISTASGNITPIEEKFDSISDPYKCGESITGKVTSNYGIDEVSVKLFAKKLNSTEYETSPRYTFTPKPDASGNYKVDINYQNDSAFIKGDYRVEYSSLSKSTVKKSGSYNATITNICGPIAAVVTTIRTGGANLPYYFISVAIILIITNWIVLKKTK
jgi:hypothetical protein